MIEDGDEMRLRFSVGRECQATLGATELAGFVKDISVRNFSDKPSEVTLTIIVDEINDGSNTDIEGNLTSR